VSCAHITKTHQLLRDLKKCNLKQCDRMQCGVKQGDLEQCNAVLSNAIFDLQIVKNLGLPRSVRAVNQAPTS
jgi:hypothetical protein